MPSSTTASNGSSSSLTADTSNLVDKICHLLSQNYVLERAVGGISVPLKAHFTEGRYGDFSEPFILILNNDLADFSGDPRLCVIPRREANQQPAENFLHRWQEEEERLYKESNYGFPEVVVHPGSIGYLRIKTLANPRKGIHTLRAALDFLENTDGLILDIRDNRGGYSELAEYLVSLYFDGPPEILSTSLYKENGQVTAYQTLSNPLSSNRLRNGEPLFFLTSRKTASAAEWLAYVLQSHGHATVVGESTAGLAHRTNEFPLNDQWALQLAVGLPLVHLTNANWEGAGVEPDVTCDASVALERALEVAADALSGL
jgi:retinol-binding protein 3